MHFWNFGGLCTFFSLTPPWDPWLKIFRDFFRPHQTLLNGVGTATKSTSGFDLWLFEIFTKISKFGRQSSQADFSKCVRIFFLKLFLRTDPPSYNVTKEKKLGVSDGFWHLCPPQSDPLFSLNFEKNIIKIFCDWPMRGLCMYVRLRSEYLSYAYHRGPLPPPLQKF